MFHIERTSIHCFIFKTFRSSLQRRSCLGNVLVRSDNRSQEGAQGEQPRFVSGLGWARPIVTRVPGQGWTADGLEVRMRPDRARQLETHVQGRLRRLHGLGGLLADEGCEVVSRAITAAGGHQATFRSVVHATINCRAVLLKSNMPYREGRSSCPWLGCDS